MNLLLHREDTKDERRKHNDNSCRKKDSQNCIKLNHNNRNRKKKGEGTNGSRGQTKIKGAERDGEGVYC